jgi:hypothetical protein
VTAPTRKDDRWLTPGVVVALILAGTIVVLGVLAAITYLTARGFDPQPVVQLTGTLLGAAAALGTFVQQLYTRRSTTKTERNTGVLAAHANNLADAVYEVADAMPRPVPRHAADDELPTAYIREAAPAPRGS